jgi:hypothetical protein
MTPRQRWGRTLHATIGKIQRLMFKSTTTMTVKRMTRNGPNEKELTLTLSQDDWQGMSGNQNDMAREFPCR